MPHNNPDEEYLESIRLEASKLLKTNIHMALEKAKYLNKKAKEGNSDKYLGVSFSLMGFCYYHNREFNQSIKYYLKARFYFFKTNNITGIFISFSAIGSVYRNKGMIEKALKTYLESLDLQQKYNISDPAAYNNISIIYYYQKDYKNALKYLKKSIKLNENTKNKGYKLKASSLINLGNIYRDTEDFNRAYSSYQKALKICNINNLPLISANAFIGLGVLYKNQGELKESKTNLEEASIIIKQIGTKVEIININLHLSEIHRKKKERKEEFLLLKESLVIAKNFQHNKIDDCLKVLLQHHIHYLDYKNAFITQEKILKELKESHKKNLDTKQEELKAQFQSKEQEIMIEQERKYNQELQSANQDLRQFNHAVGHDLRQPIRNVRSFTEILKAKLSTKLNEEEVSLLDNIIKNTQQTHEMLEGILRYSTIGINEKDKKVVNLNQVIDAVQSNLNLLINENNTTIEADQLPIIESYPNLLIQLFQNLISNAIKYRKELVAPIVKVQYKKVEGNHQLSIMDNGVGIPKAYQEKVFQLFSRVQKTRTREGSGIGLAICQKIVLKLNGEIQLLSTEGIGTTITIKFPN